MKFGEWFIINLSVVEEWDEILSIKTILLIIENQNFILNVDDYMIGYWPTWFFLKKMDFLPKF
jgi:hypothetical protein